MGQIQFPPLWLVRALGISAGEVPGNLATPDVTPVLDAYQGGAAIMDWRSFRHDVTNVAAATTTLIEADPLKFRIFWTNLGRVGGAAPTLARIRLSIRPDPSAVALELVMFNAPLGAATTQDWAWNECGRGAQFWLLPPGWRYSVSLPAGDGATDRFVINGVVGECPVGFKPW